MKLKLISMGGAALIAVTLAGCATNEAAPLKPTAHFVPGLGEIMTLTAMRHAKLWFAGQAENWELAKYELEELHEGLEDAAKFHPTHKHITTPIPALIATTMDKPLADLEAAIKTENVIAFTQRYDAVTAGCNACHQATSFGFNVVARPIFNPFANQTFSIKR